MLDMEEQTLDVMASFEVFQEALKSFAAVPTSKKRIKMVKQTSDAMSEALDACMVSGGYHVEMLLHVAQISDTAHSLQGTQADKAT